MIDPQNVPEDNAAQDDKAKNPGTNSGNGDDASSATTELETLRKELEATQNKLKEMTVITQHALADLQNFRRRSEEERASYTAYANADLLSELLPVLESMNRALVHEPKDAEWIKGSEQIFKQFQSALEKRSLKPIEAAGKPFDPKIHEALLTGPGEKDIVLQELEKGYMLGEKVLKRTRVKVGNGEQ